MSNRTKIGVAMLSLTCTGLAAGSLALPATAQPPGGEPVVVHAPKAPAIDPELQRRVPYGDLNLADKQGQKRLMWRVGAAVDDLCDANPGDNRPLKTEMQSRHCSNVAWDSARPQIRTAIELAEAGDSRRVAINITVPVAKVASR